MGKTEKPYLNVPPIEEFAKKIKARLTELTQRALTVLPLSDLVT